MAISLVCLGILWIRARAIQEFSLRPQNEFQYLLSLLKNNPKHYVGHNPADGLMIIVMLLTVLLTLLVTGITGLKALGLKGHGPLAHREFHSLRMVHADEDEHRMYRRFRPAKQDDEWWEEMHEFLTGVMLFLIVLHISGVMVSGWFYRENLILVMITGKKGDFSFSSFAGDHCRDGINAEISGRSNARTSLAISRCHQW